MKIFYALILFFLTGCLSMQPRQISTEDALWLEDPKSGDLLYCKTKGPPSDLPVCYLPRRVDGE